MIWEKAWQASATDQALAIDLGAHPDGVYLVAIQDQTTTKTRKIVKSNE
jgi:hypothetical protein